MDRAEALEYLLSTQPLAVATDLDGTISEIAPAPELAVVDATSRELLRRLADSLPLVAVISGRGVQDARRLVGLPGIVYLGNHGLERWEDGAAHVEPLPLRYHVALRSILEAARPALRLPGLIIEEKETGASIHYRLTSDPAVAREQVISVLRDLIGDTGIQLAEGRRVVELRPSLEVNKGTALFDLLTRRPIRAAVYAGDDRTDLDAFTGLRRWEQQEGGRSLAVAVSSSEMPADLRRAADVVVDGVEGWADLMDAMLTSLDAENGL
jgi:trehalose 6-phosphate phosphatase